MEQQKRGVAAYEDAARIAVERVNRARLWDRAEI
jgi:hypothetical protein